MCCLLEGRKKTRDLSGLTFLTSIEESHYSHMCSSSLHDPIFPHVQFQQEYALACLATCAVPANMHDPILPHVQFQQEYELASLDSCMVDSMSESHYIN